MTHTSYILPTALGAYVTTSVAAEYIDKHGNPQIIVYGVVITCRGDNLYDVEVVLGGERIFAKSLNALQIETLLEYLAVREHAQPLGVFSCTSTNTRTLPKKKTWTWSES